MKLSTTSVLEFASRILVTVTGFLSTFLFARYLGSDVLGQYFLLIGVVSWLEMTGQLGLTKALQKRISEQQAPGAYLAAGGLVQLAFAVLLAIGILLGSDYLDRYLGISIAVSVVLLVLVRLGYSYVRAVLRGQHKVAAAAGVESSATVIRVLAQVGIAIGLGLGFVGLVYGYILAFSIAIAVGLLLILRSDFPERPTRDHFTRLLSFAQYAWLAQLKTKTSAWMDIIVLGFFVSESLVGIYGAAWRVAVVIALASQSLAEALFPALSELNTMDEGAEFRSLSEEAMVYAGLVAIPGAVGLWLVGSDVLRIYGAEFAQGGLIVALLALSTLFSSYERQFRSVLDALDRPELTFRVNLVFLITNMVGNVVLTWQFGWVGAAVATSGSMLVSMLYAYYFALETIDISLPALEIGIQALAASVMAVAVLLVERLVAPLPYYYVAISMITGVIVYAAVVLLLSGTIRDKAVEFTSGIARAN